MYRPQGVALNRFALAMINPELAFGASLQDDPVLFPQLMKQYLLAGCLDQLFQIELDRTGVNSQMRPEMA